MYQIENFYQNHRRYLQSKSNYQLAGNTIQSHDALICKPYITNEEMGKSVSWTNTPLDPKAVASPCGAIGNSKLTQPKHSSMTLTNSRIARAVVSLSMKRESPGPETKATSTSGLPTASQCNGLTLKTSTSSCGCEHQGCPTSGSCGGGLREACLQGPTR